MYGFIYITTNNINGKKYLGMCRYSKPNWRSYIGSGKYLKQAIKKYGKKNFNREIIKECKTLEELVKDETFFLKKYNCATNMNWYNIMSSGYATNGFFGKKHTPESNKKRSEALKGKKRPRFIGEAVRKARLGKKLPKEWVENAVKKRRGANHCRAREIIINDIKYPTITEASKSLGIPYSKIYRKYVIPRPRHLSYFK